MLEISGAILTIDAMRCPKEIAHTIRDRKADSILGLNSVAIHPQVCEIWWCPAAVEWDSTNG
jgi:predicted transposase YbfD/YdcC